MASNRQIAANRRNAKKSTGPRSAEGKDRVSANAVKHGFYAEKFVIPRENAAELEALTDAFIADRKPVGIAELSLVQQMSLAHWHIMRFNTLMGDYFQRSATFKSFVPHQPLEHRTPEEAFHLGSDEVGALDRLIRAAERSYARNFNLLLKAQAVRAKSPPQVQAAPTPPAAPASGLQIVEPQAELPQEIKSSGQSQSQNRTVLPVHKNPGAPVPEPLVVSSCWRPWTRMVQTKRTWLTRSIHASLPQGVSHLDSHSKGAFSMDLFDHFTSTILKLNALRKRVAVSAALSGTVVSRELVRRRTAA